MVGRASILSPHPSHDLLRSTATTHTEPHTLTRCAQSLVASCSHYLPPPATCTFHRPRTFDMFELRTHEFQLFDGSFHLLLRTPLVRPAHRTRVHQSTVNTSINSACGVDGEARRKRHGPAGRREGRQVGENVRMRARTNSPVSKPYIRITVYRV